MALWADIVRSVSDDEGSWSAICVKEKVLITYSFDRIGHTHIYQFVQVTVIIVNRPLEPFEDELYTLLKVQSAEIDAVNAAYHQFLDHVDRELDAIVFHKFVVMLRKNEVMATHDLL